MRNSLRYSEFKRYTACYHRVCISVCVCVYSLNGILLISIELYFSQGYMQYYMITGRYSEDTEAFPIPSSSKLKDLNFMNINF